MKLCDRCFQMGNYRPGPYPIILANDEVFDLCDTCHEIIRSLINAPNPKESAPQTDQTERRKPGRPKASQNKKG
jgi:hypothetical protein